jgi:hypothetical protein
MIPELKMLFSLSNQDNISPPKSGDVKIHILNSQSIDDAREKYRDWWHGRTELVPTAVV